MLRQQFQIPLARGYSGELAKNSGNRTGLFYRQTGLAAKARRAAEREAFPTRMRLAVLWGCKLIGNSQQQAEQNGKKH